MKLSVSNDGPCSRKTACVVKQVDKHPKRFAEPWPNLTVSGLMKLMPENIEGGLYNCYIS